MLKDTAKSPNWKLAHARIREAWEIFPLSFLWATSLLQAAPQTQDTTGELEIGPEMLGGELRFSGQP